MLDPVTLSGVFSLGTRLIDKLFPDPAAAAAAKQKLAQLEQSGELEEIRVRMSAIVAEAQSPDPWTSRARPSFLYVIYLMILASIPAGIASAVAPDAMAAVVAGMRGWLAAIPEEMWTLFGVGYLGYTGARTWDKRGSSRDATK